MNDTTTCIKCAEENAYFNGVSFECPNCDYEWDEDQFEYIGSEEEEDDYDAEERKDFLDILNLKQPFFKLEQGKVYKCTVGYIPDLDYIEESIKIIPLAFKPNSNTLFLITFQDELLKEFPDMLEDLNAMSFEQIKNGSVDMYFKDTMRPALLIAGTTDHDKIVTYDENFSDFNLIN